MDTVDTTTVLCPKCPVCGNRSTVTVGRLDYERYVWDGAIVHLAFPYLDADQRELLISGTHSECWDKLFGALDESEPMYA